MVFDLDIAGDVNLAELGVAQGTEAYRPDRRVELTLLVERRALLHEDRTSDRAGGQRVPAGQLYEGAPIHVQRGVVGGGGSYRVAGKESTRPELDTDANRGSFNCVAFDIRGR